VEDIMEIVRNSIHIAGIADENELPDASYGHVFQYSETETIFIPENQPEINSIFQVMIKIEAHDFRRIKTPLGYTIALDGFKRMKMIYSQTDNSGKANFIELTTPYYAYLNVSGDVVIDNINLYILDAYFDLLDKRKIYCSLLYLVNVAEPSLINRPAQMEKNQMALVKKNAEKISVGKVGDIYNDEVRDKHQGATKEIQTEAVKDLRIEEFAGVSIELDSEYF
jgi:hypothetical protein